MLFKLGFRNIARNKRRSIITCAIMGLGLAALIFADAFLRGLNENMITSVTSSFIGDGQVHRKDFLKTREIDKTLANAKDVLSEITHHPKVDLAVPRVIASGMIASPTDILPTVIFGIDAEKEARITAIKESILDGDYDSAMNEGHILIGDRLARFLGAGVGDKVVVTSAQAGSGGLTQELFRIGAIFRLKNKDMDSAVTFMPIARAQSMLAIPNSFHEIVFRFKDRKDVVNPPAQFFNRFTQNDNEALSWKEVMPAIDAGIQLTSYSLYIGSVILFAIIALSTMNTLFMSLYERMYEFGIMKAIGTRPKFIFKLIVIEALALSLISVVAGVLIGAVITFITQKTGINHLTDVEYLGTTIREGIRPVVAIHQYTLYPVSIVVFAIISAIYPAISAAKIIPSKSMRKD